MIHLTVFNLSHHVLEDWGRESDPLHRSSLHPSPSLYVQDGTDGTLKWSIFSTQPWQISTEHTFLLLYEVPSHFNLMGTFRGSLYKSFPLLGFGFLKRYWCNRLYCLLSFVGNLVHISLICFPNPYKITRLKYIA